MNRRGQAADVLCRALHMGNLTLEQATTIAEAMGIHILRNAGELTVSYVVRDTLTGGTTDHTFDRLPLLDFQPSLPLTLREGSDFGEMLSHELRGAENEPILCMVALTGVPVEGDFCPVARKIGEAVAGFLTGWFEARRDEAAQQ